MNRLLILSALLLPALLTANAQAEPVQAGISKVDITDRDAGPVNDPLFAKALVVKKDDTTIVLVTVDAVAIGEIGRIGNDYLAKVRDALKKDLGISPQSILINASHCHGVVRKDTAALTVQAVKQAWHAMVPVKVGSGTGDESRISENRRLIMKDGSEIDMRRAYSLPADKDVASVGPIDSQIGILRLDRMDGKPLAVLYNFASHPIMGVPNGGNTADYPGFASKAIEDAMGHDSMAFFVQGCAGDINPIRYKTVTHPHDAEPLGNKLGLSVIRAIKKIECQSEADIKLIHRKLKLPRALDFEKRIKAIEAEQLSLLQSLRPTDINFKTFIPLFVQQKLSPDYPSYYSQGYLHDKAQGKAPLEKQDAVNRRNVDAYLRNIQVMEKLTRLNTNLALLKKHNKKSKAAGHSPIPIEIAAFRIGKFKMITFPGELTVQIGLNIKKNSPHPLTFVAGYTNGYIYYTPTAKQRLNKGYAQEDCDCMVSPQWQRIFESQAMELLKGL